MKNTTLIALLVSGIVFSAAAQERSIKPERSAEEIARQRTERMTEKLGLTEEQQKEVYALNLESAAKMKVEREERMAKMAELRKERGAKMAELKAERQQEQARLNELLTAEQQTILEQERAAQREKLKAMKDARRDGKFRGERPKRGERGGSRFHKKIDRADSTAVTPEKE